MYTQDAGCPIFPFEFVSDIEYYAQGKNIEFIDVNLIMYKKLVNFKDYELPKSLFGGYVASLSLAENLPTNHFKFEALPAARLLLSILYSENCKSDAVQNMLKETCNQVGVSFEDALCLMNKFEAAFHDISKNIIDNQTIYINMSSVSSVFVGLWFSNILKKTKKCTIIGIGNQINVPEIAEFATASGCIDLIENPKVNIDFNKFPKRVYQVLKNQFFEYPTYFGMRIIPYQISYGCPGKCNYCTERKIWNKNGEIRDCLEHRNIDECIEEIKYFIDEYRISGLTFDDCMINFKLHSYRKLASFLQENNMFLSGSMRIDILDDDMIALLKSLNFTNIIVGLETLNESSVKKYNKSNSKTYIDKAWEVVPKLHENGIMTQVNMIFASPFESEEDILNAITEDKRFITYLKEKGAPVNNVSLGEIVINYPSEQYFQIMKDSSYSIIYNQVPDCIAWKIPEVVRTAFEKIPNRAIRDSKNTLYKNNLATEVATELLLNDRERIISNLNIMMIHWPLYLREWRRREVCIKMLNKPINQASGKFSNLINELIDKDYLEIEQSIKLCGIDEKQAVASLITLCLLGIIEICDRA